MSSAGVGPLCFLKSTVNTAVYQDILEHFMPPSADKLYRDADFIFQQDLAPATLPKVPKSGSMTMVLLCLIGQHTHQTWTPYENLRVIVKRKMRDTRPNNADDLKAAIKVPWALLHLSSATDWSPSCHAALMQSFMQKEAQPIIECIEMNILFRSLTFLFKISFFYWSYVIF